MPPVDDFSFVDAESMGIAHAEAGRSADRAININDRAASSANQMVVVVADTVLIPGRRARGLDAAHQVLVDQCGKGVVHRLT